MSVQKDIYTKTLREINISDFKFHSFEDRPIDIETEDSIALMQDMLKNGILEYPVISKDGYVMAGRHKCKIIVSLEMIGKWADIQKCWVLDEWEIGNKDFNEVVGFMQSFNKRAQSSKREGTDRIKLIKSLMSNGFTATQIKESNGFSLTMISKANTINSDHEVIKAMLEATKDEDRVSVDTLQLLSKFVGNDPSKIIPNEILELKGTEEKLKKKIEAMMKEEKTAQLKKQLGNIVAEVKPELDMARLEKVYSELDAFINGVDGDEGIGIEDLEEESPDKFLLWNKLQWVFQLDLKTKESRELMIKEEKQKIQDKIDGKKKK